MARVLIATDGSDCAISAARTALTILGRPDQLGVLCVVDVRAELAVGGGGLVGAEPLAMSLADPATTADLDDAMVREAGLTVERTIAALGTDVDADRLVVRGEPASEICRVLEDGGYDVVVVGSHGSGLVKRVLVGSVSNAVVHHATRPVLVVRERPPG